MYIFLYSKINWFLNWRPLVNPGANGVCCVLWDLCFRKLQNKIGRNSSGYYNTHAIRYEIWEDLRECNIYIAVITVTKGWGHHYDCSNEREWTPHTPHASNSHPHPRNVRPNQLMTHLFILLSSAMRVPLSFFHILKLIPSHPNDLYIYIYI